MTARRGAAGLREQLAEAQQTLDAIRSGSVDAIVVNGPRGEQIFTLEGAERSFRVLVEAMTEGAATLEIDGTILYCNPRFAQMLARSPNRLVGKSLRAFVEPAHRRTFDALLSEGRRRDSKREITLTASTGLKVPTYLSVSAMSSDGRHNRQVLCLVATDLTEQKRSEEMLAAERLASSVFDQASEAIVVCDLSERIVRASDAAHRLCGGDALLRSFAEVFPLIADKKPVTGVARGKKAIVGLAVSLLRPDGQAFSLLLSAGPLLGNQGKVLGRIICLTDVTRLTNVERDLQSAIAVRDEFLSIASHELRTPLTTLLLQIQSLRDALVVGAPVVPGAPRKLEIAERQTSHLNKLIDGLLDVSRITTGQMRHVRQKIELTGLARGVVESWRSEARRAGCSFAFRGTARVIGSWDPMRIEQVLGNLVENAIKYGRSKPISVRVSGAGKFAKIVVRDHGIGISVQDTQRIFERFERAVSSPIHYGGLGLGLFVAGRIVEAYGGTISVASKLDEGTEFTVSLPRGTA